MILRFSTILDSNKTGLGVKEAVFQKDKVLLPKRPPCMNPDSAEDLVQRRAKPFILENLVYAGQQKGKELLSQYDIASREFYPEGSKQAKDQDLVRPYNRAFDRAVAIPSPQLAEELRLIRVHVNLAYKAWFAIFQKHYSTQHSFLLNSSVKSYGRGKKTSDLDDRILRIAASFSRPVEGLVFLDEIDDIKASYAYSCGTEFAVSVAFKHLCIIKAKAAPGGNAPVTRAFDELKTVSKASIRARNNA